MDGRNFGLLAYVRTMVPRKWPRLNTKLFICWFFSLYKYFLPEYACTYEKQKGILSPGRLYATENYLCFYANIFGQETYLTIQWKNVKTLTEEKAAFVFPNAIQVIFLEKYFLIQVINYEIVIKFFHPSHNLT